MSRKDGAVFPLNEEDFEEAKAELEEEVNEVIEAVEKDEDITNEELEYSMKLVEFLVEKSQQLHRACKKRLEGQIGAGP